MWNTTAGERIPTTRKAHAVLSVREPLIESLVVGLGVEGSELNELRRFCKAWVRYRNRFDIGRKRIGLFGRIGKEDADRVLKRALSELVEGGGQ